MLHVTMCLMAPAWGIVQQAGPVIPGLFERHQLDQVSVGRLLMDELRCAACHEGIGPGLVPATGPDLAEVGGRVAPDYLQRFIADPWGTRPGTKMPGVLHSLPTSERAEAAQAITHFLVDASSRRGWSRGEVEEHEVAAGDDLFHTVGCVACHAPRRPAADGTEDCRAECGGRGPRTRSRQVRCAVSGGVPLPAKHCPPFRAHAGHGAEPCRGKSPRQLPGRVQPTAGLLPGRAARARGLRTALLPGIQLRSLPRPRRPEREATRRDRGGAGPGGGCVSGQAGRAHRGFTSVQPRQPRS